MESLRQALDEIRDRITRYQGRKLNEENTKATLIDPVLRALGWDLEDLEEVQHEFKIKRADKPVDYAFLIGRTPRLFVEAKALGHELTDWKWAKQIMGYAGVAGVPWVVLTNGDQYRIYNAHATVPVEKKLFRAFDISGGEPVAEETLALLSREELEGKRIDDLWQAHFVDQRVRGVIEDLFGPGAPDASLTNLVKKRAEGLSTKEVRASLTRVRIALDFPLESVIYKKTKRTKERIVGTGKVPGRVDASLADLIKAGIITPPLSLHKTYKGRKLAATIVQGGSVAFQGTKYESLSMAGSIARKTVIGTPAGRKYPPTNGWRFWQFVDHDGRTKEIDELRRRYLGRKDLKVVGKSGADVERQGGR